MNPDTKTPGPDEWEWEYAPPPTVYDLVRDTFLIRFWRILVHCTYRNLMRFYNRLQRIGREHFVRNWPCIITPNHSSHLDTLAVFSALPLSQINRTCAVAARDYFFSNPYVSVLSRLVVNCIPMERQGFSKRALKLCAEKLYSGHSLIIFPEGTRSHTPELGSFKPGVVMLSRRIRVPIIPTYIKGTRESLSKAHLWPRKADITVVFSEPVCFWHEELAGLDHEQAAEYLRNKVDELKQSLNTENAENKNK